MKKKVYLILLLGFLLIVNIIGFLNSAPITGNSITGKLITGDATSNVDFNISITLVLPNIVLSSPKNQTYMTNQSLLLDFTINEADTIWYNLDNTANITITSSLTFNTTEGDHILFLYANSSLGNVSSKNVSFVSNLTSFIIIDDEYEVKSDLYEDNGEMYRYDKRGDTTDFLNYSYTEMQSLSGLVLDIPNYGKISFNLKKKLDY